MASNLQTSKIESRAHARPVFPFTALVGQDEMKLALLLNVIAPSVGGVLIMGHRGTGKSTAVRALADLLAPLKVVRDCPFNCDPEDTNNLCRTCLKRLDSDGKLTKARKAVPFVDLPLGATEDRVCGSIDFESALKNGVKSFEPGLLARVNRGFLYIDEVNLLEDHLVDLLLDVSVTGRNTVEREGISIEHPSRFVLVGSGNPEEGELRPQLLDRFGLSTEVQTVLDLDERISIVERREEFDRDSPDFLKLYEPKQAKLRRRLERARRAFAQVEVPRELLRQIAELCVRLKIDGHRGELTIARASRALAAFEGRKEATATDVRRVAAMSLRHRLRRDPLEQTSGGGRVEDETAELFGDTDGVGEQMTPPNHPADPGTDRSGGNMKRDRHRNKDVAQHDAEFSHSTKPSEHTDRDEIVPPAEALLPDDTFSAGSLQKNLTTNACSSRRGLRSKISPDAKRGRYTRATQTKRDSGVVAIDATLRAAATPRAVKFAAYSQQTSLRVSSEDIRFKRFSRKTGTLYILAVDASGSMAVNRINQAKGALAHLLRRSYLNRDRVALVSFCKQEAELLLPPSKSPARAKKMLDALPVGGATPLAAGLMRVLCVARRAKHETTATIVLAIFTDGRANVMLGDGSGDKLCSHKKKLTDEIARVGGAIRDAGVASFVIDTQSRFTSGGEGRFLADALGGRYHFLPLSVTAHSIAEVFQ